MRVPAPDILVCENCPENAAMVPTKRERRQSGIPERVTEIAFLPPDGWRLDGKDRHLCPVCVALRPVRSADVLE